MPGYGMMCHLIFCYRQYDITHFGIKQFNKNPSGFILEGTGYIWGFNAWEEGMGLALIYLKSWLVDIKS